MRNLLARIEALVESRYDGFGFNITPLTGMFFVRPDLSRFYFFILLISISGSNNLRTATVLLNNDTHTRKLDRRKGKAQERNLSLTSQSTAASTSFLSGAFLRERHLCQRPTKGASAQSFLSSSVTEADFVATPRTGKALDFIYRMSLFEKPIVNLDGKAFTIQDSTARGHHRADASALEISDASLSAILYGIGKERGGTDPTRHIVEEGKDGYPLIFMKFNGNPGDESKTEIKPYRVSFVRAALMVTSARQEAQLQVSFKQVHLKLDRQQNV